MNQFKISLLKRLKQSQIDRLINKELHNPYKTFANISKKDLINFYKNKLCEGIDNKNNVIIALFSNDKLMGLAKIEALVWYSKLLRVKSAKLDLFLGSGKHKDTFADLLIRHAILYAKNASIRYLSVRIDRPGHKLIRILSKYKFKSANKFTDMYLDQFKKSNIPSCRKGIKIQSSIYGDDVRQIKRIAYSSYNNCLLKERRFKCERVRNFYSYWAQQCCNGKADRIITIREQNKSNKIMGFIACSIFKDKKRLLHKKIGFVNLIVIDKNYQNKDLGTLLLKAAINWFAKKKVSFIELSVSSNNRPAIRLYKRTGFKNFSHSFQLYRFLN